MRSGIGFLLGLVAVVVLVAVVAVFGLGGAGLPAPDGIPTTRRSDEGVSYAPLRVVIGLGAAAAFLVLAGWLIRTTDWSRPEGDPFESEERGE